MVRSRFLEDISDLDKGKIIELETKETKALVDLQMPKPLIELKIFLGLLHNWMAFILNFTHSCKYWEVCHIYLTLR